MPTPQELVEKMLDMAKVTPQDIVIDLGSGDGRNVIAAAKRGASALRLRVQPRDGRAVAPQSAGSRRRRRATFIEGDMFEADISKATVMALFLLPSNLDKLAPKFLTLDPARASSTTPSRSLDGRPTPPRRSKAAARAGARRTSNIIPARAAGTWRLGTNDLALTQEFQIVSGTLGTTAIAGGRLNGEQISFKAGDTQYRGKVSGDRMEGTATTAGKTQSWTATKGNSSSPVSR